MQFDTGDQVMIKLTGIKWDFDLEEDEEAPILPSEVTIKVIAYSSDKDELMSDAVDAVTEQTGFCINSMANAEIISVDET